MLDAARNLLSGEDIDHLLIVGKSLNYRQTTDQRREHIVPCILIHNKAIEMTKCNASITVVAQMIKHHLAIVLITQQEADYVDIELGLKTSMPEGWDFGQNVFARLDAAKIKLQ